ncbi:MAG TPA: pyruvate oxidase, partial [Vicinamibacteria bacterium]|nr:pyruvate oxidase [Vicinamibacteria bacterium]
KVAEACGGMGFRIEDPAQCGRVLDQALAAPGPVVVEAVVDPFEPPMPPQATVEQARKLAEALIKGEPARDKIVRAVLKNRIREMI